MSDPQSLKNERFWLKLALISFAILCLTGFGQLIDYNHSFWSQWSLLIHICVGFVLSVLVPFYLYTHIWRTLGFRRAIAAISGLLGTLVLLGLIISGVRLSFPSLGNNSEWLAGVHLTLAWLSLIGFTTHLVIHRIWIPEHRLTSKKTPFHSLYGLSWAYILLWSSFIFLVVGVLTSISHVVTPSFNDEPEVVDYEYPYGKHPFRPSQTETQSGSFVDEKLISGSERCGTCHKVIAQEWSESIHRHAADDPTYITNVSLLAQNKGIAATRYCEGCHAPIALLSGQLSEGGKHGGLPGTPAHHEGVSCLSCHGISEVVHLKGVASYEFSPAKQYLFDHSENEFLKAINHYMIQVNPTQHKMDMARAPLSTPELCATCHAQFMDKDLNGWGWVKMQDEYSAWLASNFSHQNHQDVSLSEIQDCKSCHMSYVFDPKDPSRNKQDLVKSHRFAAANTVVPLLKDYPQQMNAVIDFLKTDKLNLSIQTMKANDNLLSFEVIITNKGVGHNFPGGTIDINEAWIEVEVRDSSGKVFFNSGKLQEDESVDPQAHFYRSLPIDPKGELVWKHDLFNRVGEAYKDVIKSGESDRVQYTTIPPKELLPPFEIEAKLNYRKLNVRYAKWALKDLYQSLPVVVMARDQVIFEP